jgi:hypothetical protein
MKNPFLVHIKQEGIEEQIIAGLNTSERLAFQVNR